MEVKAEELLLRRVEHAGHTVVRALPTELSEHLRRGILTEK